MPAWVSHVFQAQSSTTMRIHPDPFKLVFSCTSMLEHIKLPLCTNGKQVYGVAVYLISQIKIKYLPNVKHNDGPEP